jgi:hypothetical protein
MKAQLIRDMTCDLTAEFPEGIKVAGTIIEHPQAWELIGHGVAIPADDACRKRAGMTEAQMAAAQYAAVRTLAGIHPDDFAKYDAGEIAGYNPDGSYIPGPNAPDLSVLEEEEQ